MACLTVIYYEWIDYEWVNTIIFPLGFKWCDSIGADSKNESKLQQAVGQLFMQNISPTGDDRNEEQKMRTNRPTKT